MGGREKQIHTAFLIMQPARRVIEVFCINITYPIRYRPLKTPESTLSKNLASKKSLFSFVFITILSLIYQ